MESKDEVSDTDSGIILQSGEGFSAPDPTDSSSPRLQARPGRGAQGGGGGEATVRGSGVQTLEGLRVFLPGGRGGSGLEGQSYLNSYLPCSALAPRFLRS